MGIVCDNSHMCLNFLFSLEMLIAFILGQWSVLCGIFTFLNLFWATNHENVLYNVSYLISKKKLKRQILIV